jgi:hypothetical protein
MPIFGDQHRNHSFPPSFRFVQNYSSKHLAPPLPNIDDEPWAHFITTTVLDNEDDEDYLDFSAGILTSSEVSKKKPSKFRPSNSKKWGRQIVNYHHGTFPRTAEPHGFVENRHDPWSHVVEYDIKSSMEAEEREVAQLRLRGRSKTRTHSGHRHSWREPSVDLFTVDEEADTAQATTDNNTPAKKTKTVTFAASVDDIPIFLPDVNNRAKL